MDTDDIDEVVFRHHPGQQRNNNNHSYQKQPHNNHYHFNPNNHLLNHSHSMQQAGYTKQRYSAMYNGGKSLDSGLDPDDGKNYRASSYYYDVNSPVHSYSNNSQK